MDSQAAASTSAQAIALHLSNLSGLQLRLVQFANWAEDQLDRLQDRFVLQSSWQFQWSLEKPCKTPWNMLCSKMMHDESHSKYYNTTSYIIHHLYMNIAYIYSSVIINILLYNIFIVMLVYVGCIHSINFMPNSDSKAWEGLPPHRVQEAGSEKN